MTDWLLFNYPKQMIKVTYQVLHNHQEVSTRVSRSLHIKLLQHQSLCVQMVECYILQRLAASSTSSNSQVLHDETGTHSEVPQKIETCCNT